MDQGTQQNAAMVEEQTAASHSLATEAAALNNLLSQFTFEEGRGAPVAVASRSSAPAASPARALASRVTKAFGGGASSSAAVKQEWSEF